MSGFFLKIVNMSISASWLVLAVLLLRLVLKKAPKWVSVLLWGFVAIRLVCPFSIESMLSLIPSAETISPEIMMDWTPEVSTGIDSLDTVVNPIITGSFAPKPYASANPLQILIPVCGNLWILGILVMLAYTAVSYILLRRKVATAVLLKKNIYQSENVDSPFVLGIIKPKIYLPFRMDGQNLEHVIAHEESHIRRKDHWWKPFGFVLLAIHWFNPVMWLGYILLCRDIELACDEKVIKEMDNEHRADYTQALVACSVGRRSIAACPLAFGEVGVKERVKSVMNYRKPAFWIVIAAIVTCSVVAVCFLTNPKASFSGALPNIHSHTYVVEEVTYESGRFSFSVIAGQNSPIYAVTEDMTLVSQKEHSVEGTWAQLGKLEEAQLTKENFDDLFKDPGNWADKATANSIRNHTENAWQLIYNQDVLYYILQQKNGDLYLAYGYYDYAEKNDPYSDDTSILWLYKLAIDTNGLRGMTATSGSSAVPLLSFPEGTAIGDYADSLYWLTINPGEDEFVPFITWKDGKEIRGTYTAYDAETFEPLKHFIPSGLDPQTYLFQNADPDRTYIVLAVFSTDANAEVYAFGAKFQKKEPDTNKLRSLVSEIANNPDCAASSNPFTYIEARKSRYNEILTYGADAVEFFVEQLRTGDNGLQGYIMAVACADITGIGDKDAGADWATAQEWLALYDKNSKNTIIPPVIATDYISDKQARLLSLGYTCDKPGQSAAACGIAPWQGEYGEGNTLVLDGENGQNQILLTPKGASLSQYRIYLPDGTVYDDGTRTLYDSLSPRVMYSNERICLTSPFQTGEYIYEVELSWPGQGLTVTYGLKIVMTGEESNYDRALDSVFSAYGEGNPLISVSLVDKYAIGNAVSHSPRYLFKVENIPNAPIWVEVSQITGKIIGEVKYYERVQVYPPYVDGQMNYFDSGPVETVNGNLKTYYRNTDGTWQVDGRNYRYRLVITGRMNNAAVDSTFIYLSNLEKITFDQAWKAAGLSSDKTDYFDVEDAVLVEWLSGGTKEMTLTDVVELSKLGMDLTWEDLKEYEGEDIGSGLYVVKYDIDPEFYLLVGDGKTTGEPMYAYLNAISNGASCDIRESDVETFIRDNQSDALDYAIYKAIIERNGDGTFPDFPNGLIPTEVHYILGIESKSGTPVVGQQNHMEETTVYIHYVYGRYSYSSGEPSKAAGTATTAKITFSVDPENGYTLKEFWEPDGGSVYAEEIRANFPKDIADMVLDPQSHIVDTEKMEHACLVKVQEYISGLTD